MLESAIKEVLVGEFVHRYRCFDLLGRSEGDTLRVPASERHVRGLQSHRPASHQRHRGHRGPPGRRPPANHRDGKTLARPACTALHLMLHFRRESAFAAELDSA